MAIGVGFIVGYAVRIFGKGIGKILGVVGAVLSLVGCLLGNFFTIVGFYAKEERLNIIQTLINFDYSYLGSVLIETGTPMDLLFYGIAIYEGYKFSFKKITEEELIPLTK